MRQRCFSLFFAITALYFVPFTATGCRQEVNSSVVQIDDEHYLWREDARPYLVYRVPASNEFVLDATGYKFDTSKFNYNFDPQRDWHSATDLSPNLIQIIIGVQENAARSEDTTEDINVYRTEWHSNSQQHRINAQTLIPVKDSGAFTKTEPGQRIIVEIGRLEKDESTNEETFYSFWSGMIDIQE